MLDRKTEAYIDAIENERVEESLIRMFADLGPVQRDFDDDGELVGWTILKRVRVARSTLPVDFADETESEACAGHRQKILDMVREAYAAGRHAQRAYAAYSAEVAAETEEVWTVDSPQPLTLVTTRQRVFHESDETGEPRQPDGYGKVETIRERQASLDREFAPYAAIEAIIRDAVPAGTSVTRASAGGDLGWRIGAGWMSVEGTDAGRPDQIRDFARSLAAIPPMKWEKARNGDPEFVRRTLAAGRAH